MVVHQLRGKAHLITHLIRVRVWVRVRARARVRVRVWVRVRIRVIPHLALVGELRLTEGAGLARVRGAGEGG